MVRAARFAFAALLAFTLGACGGVRDQIHGRAISARFDARELVDVLPPGAVPPIDAPEFESPTSAAERLQPPDPVAVVRIGEDARAYPLAILLWHEVVNDTIGSVPVAVTYSPLAGASMAFRRTIEGRALTFRASGKLFRSNLIMYDRETHSLWPQLRGAAALGPLSGRTLERVPLQVASFGEFRASYPEGAVLTAKTGAARVYGTTPYAGYDDRAGPSDSFFAPAADRREKAMERVIGVGIGNGARAYPFPTLRSAGGVARDRVGAEDIVVLWRAGTRSVLDTSLIADARDAGSAGVFAPESGGLRLDLSPVAEGFRDAQTGSTWSVLGVATAGPLKGSRLDPVVATEALWFAWAAFEPATSLFGAPS